MSKSLYDMISNIKNGQLSKRNFVIQKRKKICENILKIMWDEGFIKGYTLYQMDKLQIFLKYNKSKPVIQAIRSVSKPSKKIYYSIKQIWKIDSNKCFMIISTNKGLKSIIECKKLKIGGEPLLVIN